MSMNQNDELKRYFDKDVTSVSDYMCRIREINDYIMKKNKNWKAFYRGDCYCTKTQSKFFREGELSCENRYFEEWKENNQKLLKAEDSEFIKLAKMQHYCGYTRLLDFSKDFLVALRFACGEKKDMYCPKKVTLYNTDYIEYEDGVPNNVIDAFMRMVTSNTQLNNIIDGDESILSKDYFVDIPLDENENSDFERIKRQKGLFLLMGNFRSYNINRGKTSRFSNTKVKHELSPTVGRGRNYEGYVGVLRISPYHVDEIREKLERQEKYSMKYLMADK